MLRPASKEDFPVFADLIKAMIKSSPAALFGFSPKAVAALFGGGCLGLVADVDGRPAGFVLFYVSPSIFNPSESAGMVFLWGVLPEFRGAGVGRALLAAAADACREAGARGVCIMTTEGPPAHTARTLGFGPYKVGLIKEL